MLTGKAVPAPSGQLHSWTGFIFHSPAIPTLVKPQFLAWGYGGALGVLGTKRQSPLCFPRLDPDAPDTQLLLGSRGSGQIAAKLPPQVVPGSRRPLPGKFDLQEVSQVLLSVDQEGVGGVEPKFLYYLQT